MRASHQDAEEPDEAALTAERARQQLESLLGEVLRMRVLLEAPQPGAGAWERIREELDACRAILRRALEALGSYQPSHSREASGSSAARPERLAAYGSSG